MNVRSVQFLLLASIVLLLTTTHTDAQPQIQITPDSIAVFAPYGDSMATALTIGNTGTDSLHVTLEVRRAASGLIYTAGAQQEFDPASYASAEDLHAGTPAATPAVTDVPSAFIRTTRAAGGARVLIAAADNATNISSLLLAYADIAAVDYFDTRSGTPALSLLNQYDVVISWCNYNHQDRNAVGDVLADYVDAGGSVILLSFSHYSPTGLGIGGRIVSGNYDPLVSTGAGDHYTYAQLGVFNGSHPIMQGVTSVQDLYRDYVNLAAGAELIAGWNDGEEFVAVKNSVAGINAYVGDSRSWTGDVALVVHNAVVFLAKPSWLSLSASSAVVAPGGSLNVTVTASALNLYGGIHTSIIRISGDDSAHAVTDVPVTFTVTGSPSMIVSTDTLRFGQYYVGYPDTLSFTVSNSGTDSLRIGAVASSDPECVVLTPTPFVIGVNASADVSVMYSRTTAKTLAATLTITNNDSTQLDRQVIASGSSLLPPVIGTVPDVLSLSASVGDSASTTIQLQNSGSSDLQWEILNLQPVPAAKLESIASALRARGRVSPPSPAGAQVAAVGETAEQVVAEVRYPATLSATNLNIGLVAADAGTNLADVASALVATGRFASVTFINANQVTPTLEELQAFDAILVWANYSFIDATAFGNLLADYVDAGGGVVTAVFGAAGYIGGRFEAENYRVLDGSSTLSGRASLGYVYLAGHPVMDSVVSFNGGSSSYRYSGGVVSGGRRIADWSDGYPLAADRLIHGVARVDLGFFPPSSNVSSSFWESGTDGDRLMANALEYVGHKFLSVSPSSGTLSAASSTGIAITAHAAGIVGGTYREVVRFTSNDPARRTHDLPVEFHVTGTPNIVLSADTLDFGSGFVTYPDTLSFTIFNTGTDSLTVSGFTSGNPEVTVVDASPFTLGVNRNRVIRVRYSRGTVAGLLTAINILNSDPDSSNAPVVIQGVTILPPVISVNPTTIPRVAITSGDSTTRSIAVQNTGSSPLIFAAGVAGPQSGGGPISMKSGVLPILSGLRQAGMLMPSPVPHEKKENRIDRSPGQPKPIARTLSSVALPFTLIDTLGYSWDVYNSGYISNGSNDAFDGGYQLSPFDYVYSAETEDNGRELVLGPAISDSISIVRKVFVPSNAAFIRYLDIFTNTTLAPRSISVYLYTNLGSDGDEEFSATSSGDSILTTADSWIVTDDIQNADRPAVTYVFGGAGGTVAPAAVYGGPMDGYYQVEYLLEIPPASEVILMQFGTQRFNGTEGVASAAALSLLGGEALAGMLKTEMLHVANFAVPTMFGVTPLSGSIAAGNVDSVYAIYDADSVVSGEYAASLGLYSNDPVTPVVHVALSSLVTGIPRIAVSQDTLDFGEGFIGYPDTLAVTISNPGTDSLTVSSISFSSGAFSVLETAPFTLRVNRQRTLHVVYDRSSIAAVAESMLVVSNDPIATPYPIDLLATTVATPVIGVSPDSLGFSVRADDSASTTITLSNTGAGILTWSIPRVDSAGVNPGIERVASAMRARAAEPAFDGAALAKRMAVQSGRWTAADAVTVRSAASVQAGLANVAVVGADDNGYMSDVQGKLLATGRFASVTLIHAESVTPTLNDLLSFDAVLVWRNYSFANGTALGNALADYIDAGGGVVTAVFTGDGSSLAGRFVSADYWAIEPGYVTTGQAGLGTVSVPEHPTMTGVASFNGGYESYRYVAGIHPDAIRVADWSDGRPLVASRIINGSPRVDLGFFPPSSDVGGPWFWDASTDGTKLLANALSYAANNFISISPLGGTLPSGGSQNVTVKVSAKNLVAGLYSRSIDIQSNDPVSPVVPLPVTMSVNGNPAIVLSADTLAFGEGFLGYPDTVSIRVSNRGTGQLVVGDITFDNAEFSAVDSTPFIVRINGDRDARIRIARATLGENPGTMTLATNDTNHLTVPVTLSGLTIDPPVFTLSPDSLDVTLSADSGTVRTLTIGNAGVSDLQWSGRVYARTASSEALMRVAQGMQKRATAPSSSALNGTGGSLSELPAGNSDAAVVLSFTATPGLPNVAILAADGPSSVADVRTKLLSTGKFSSVTSIEANALTPTLNELLMYDAVLVWTNSGVQDPIALGNALADYVDAGGGVVTGVWGASPGYIQGRFTGSDYWAMSQSYVTSGQASLGVVLEPRHPVMDSVRSLNGGSSSYRYQGGVASGARRIANWTDGNPLVVERNINGSTRIDLGLYPPSSTVSGNLWQSGTDGARLMANALGYVGRTFVTLVPTGGTIAGGASIDVDMVVDADRLVEGTYENLVRVVTNDPGNPVRSSVMQLTVQGTPAIAVVPDSLDFGDGFIGQIDTLAFTVRNAGSDILIVGGMTLPSSEFELLDSTLFALDPFQTYRVRVRYVRTALGQPAGLMTISSNDSTAPLFSVHVTGSTSMPPVSAGDAAVFDGVTQYAEVQYDASSPLFSLTNRITYEAWVNPLSTGPIITRGQCNVAWPDADIIISGSAPSYDLIFYLNYANWDYYTTFSVASVLPRGRWSHVAVTYDASTSTVNIYVNGVLVHAGSYSSNVWLPTSSLWIMGVPSVGGGCPNVSTQGSIDEVRIWNVARTQDQIRQNMHSSLSAAEPHLVGYWRFDEYTGAEATDNSGEGHPAILRNEATHLISGAEIHTGKQYRPGRLVVSADARPTSNAGFSSAPSGSAAKFVTNLASFFSGGTPGRFLIYSNDETFGTQFRNTLLSAGHLVDQSLSPLALGTYKGIFVGGNTSMDIDSLMEYVREGGSLYIASGATADTTEEASWDQLTSAYGIRLHGESGIPLGMNRSFLPHPLSTGVFGLSTEDPSTMTLSNGYLSRTQIVSSKGSRFDLVVYDGTALSLLPGTPELSSPPDGSSFSSTTQQLQWYANFSVLRYRLEVASDASFSTMVKDTLVTNNQVTLTGLRRNTTHYWRVSAMTGAGIGKPSVVWNFKTVPDAPPGIPVLTFPADAATNVNISTTFSWQRSDNASVYQFQLAHDSLFSSIAVNDSSVTDTSRTPAPFMTNHQYFWRVRAINLEGESDWSPYRTFTTEVLPDLQVAAMEAPPSAFSGQTIDIRWVTTNAGDGPTSVAVWYDRIYLSPDSVFDPNLSIHLGTYQNTYYLNSGDSSVQTATVSLANGLSGKFYVFAQSDVFSNMRESNEANNWKPSSAVTVTLTPPPDLQVQTIVTPANTFSGQQIHLYWTIRNVGTGTTRSAAWSDAVYLSQDAIFQSNTDPRLATVAHYGELGVDSTYLAEANVTIPHTMFGTWYLLVQTDVNNSVFEFAADDNNLKASDSILVTLNPPPDLAVTGITAPPTGESGRELLVQWRVVNEGLGVTFENSWRDAVYLSGTPTFDAGQATLLGSTGHYGRLDVDSSYGAGLRVTLPEGIQGTYYLHVRTDYLNQVFEHTFEDNNVVVQDTAVTVSLSPWPDLIVESVDAPDSITAGQPVQVSYRIRNTGTSATPGTSWSDYLYVSPNSYWDPQIATYLRSLPRLKSLGQDEYYDRPVEVTIPSNYSGPYYFYIVTDASGSVYEHTSEGNNVGGSGAMFVMDYPPIDLAVDSLFAPSSVSSGDTVVVAWKVANQGLGATTVSTWMDIVYLSADSIFNPAGDQMLKSRERIGTLAGGTSYVRQQQIVIPDGIAGTYYLFFSTDLENRTGDVNLGNNYLRFPQSLGVTLTPSPDLAVTSITTVDSIDIGQPVTIYYGASNIGTGPIRTGTWFDAVYLSEDSTLSPGDRRLGLRGRIIPRDAGSTYNDSLEVTIPAVADGMYYLIMKADNREDVYEGGNESNNVLYTSVRITHPLPGDVVVTTIAFADTVTVGEQTTVFWTLRNTGINRISGYLTDAVYVSSDTSWNIDDPLLGISTHYVTLDPGMSEVISVKANLASVVLADSTGATRNELPGVPPGAYHIIVRSDIRNNISELDNDNNTSASPGVMRALVPNIAIDVPAIFSLTRGAERYYGLWATAGEALELTLRSNIQSASNEVYVRFGAMPSRREFDAVFGNPFASDQDVIIPGTREGMYYILVRCDAGLAIQRDTLTARYIDYQVRSVKPRKAGNSGEVTLRIEGARFSQNTTFALVPAGVSDSAARIEAVRSSLASTIAAYATFDLTGAPVGMYDLYAENRFTWVAADLSDTSNITYSIQSVVDSTILPNALEVVQGADPRLEVRVATPGAVPVNRDFAITLEVFNAGNVDIKAPVVRISSPTRVPLDLRPPVNPSAPSERTILVLAPGERKDVFAPGERTLVRLYTRAPGRGTPFVRFIAEDLSASAGEGIVWSDLESSFRDSSSPSDWAATWANVQLMGGSTFGSLHDQFRRLAANRMPSEDQAFFFGSDLMQELVGLARNGIITVPATDAAAMGVRFSQAEIQHAIDSVNTLLRMPTGDHQRISYNQMLCDGLLDSFQSQYANDAIDNQVKFCSACYTSFGCAYASFSVASAAIRTLWALESAVFRRPYILLSYDRWADSEGDISYTEFDQIGADIKTSAPLRVRRDQIIDYAIPRVKYFLRSDEFNCGQGLYNITDFVPQSFMNSGLDFSGEGGNPEHGPTRTLGGVSPSFTGYVTVVNVATYPDGKKKFEVKFNLHLHIHDRYDFCPSSGVGTFQAFDFVFYLLRQAEQCGIVQPYYNTIDVDVEPRIKFMTCGGSGTNGGNGGDDDDSDGNDGDGDDGPPTPPAPPDPDPDQNDVPVLAPSDPNDILGPAGFGDRRWVAGDQTLEYTIRYENNPEKATAPAQVVTITHQLDSTADARTFRVGNFGFGSFSFDVPPGRAFYQSRLDLRDSLGLYVDVNAGIDITTNRAFWIFTSIDPATGQQPLNPLSGYLLLNDSLGHGEGFVMYTVRPKRAVPSGSLLNAQARIVFDQEDPIDTPPIFNTIDTGIPSSSVRMSYTRVDSVSYGLTWYGSDDTTGSGLRSYSVYVSKNDEEYLPWLADVPDTSGTFVGEFGARYRFFSIARDNAGNIEAVPADPDLTFVVTSVPDGRPTVPAEFALQQNYPNPFNPVTTLEYALPTQSHVTLTIYNVLGQQVRRLVDATEDAGYRAVVWDSRNEQGFEVSTGVYFYRIEAEPLSGRRNSFTQVRKMLLMK